MNGTKMFHFINNYKCFLYQTTQEAQPPLHTHGMTTEFRQLSAEQISVKILSKTSVKVAFQSIFQSHLLNHLIPALICAD